MLTCLRVRAQGGVGQVCRFCGFSPYVACPDSELVAVEMSLTVDQWCPSVCGASSLTCTYDPECGVSRGQFDGCAAGNGRFGKQCRLCGEASKAGFPCTDVDSAMGELMQGVLTPTPIGPPLTTDGPGLELAPNAPADSSQGEETVGEGGSPIPHQMLRRPPKLSAALNVVTQTTLVVPALWRLGSFAQKLQVALEAILCLKSAVSLCQLRLDGELPVSGPVAIRAPLPPPPPRVERCAHFSDPIENTDLHGSVLEVVPVTHGAEGSVDVGECCAACATTAACKAFVHFANFCYLKAELVGSSTLPERRGYVRLSDDSLVMNSGPMRARKRRELQLSSPSVVAAPDAAHSPAPATATVHVHLLRRPAVSMQNLTTADAILSNGDMLGAALAATSSELALSLAAGSRIQVGALNTSLEIIMRTVSFASSTDPALPVEADELQRDCAALWNASTDPAVTGSSLLGGATIRSQLSFRWQSNAIGTGGQNATVSVGEGSSGCESAVQELLQALPSPSPMPLQPPPPPPPQPVRPPQLPAQSSSGLSSQDGADGASSIVVLAVSIVCMVGLSCAALLYLRRRSRSRADAKGHIKSTDTKRAHTQATVLGSAPEATETAASAWAGTEATMAVDEHACNLPAAGAPAALAAMSTAAKPSALPVLTWSQLYVGIELGKGTLHRVHHSTFHGRPVAVRKVRRTLFSEAEWRDEVERIAAVHHVHLFRAIALVLPDASSSSLGLVMSLAPRSLAAVIALYGETPLMAADRRLALRVAAQASDGLAHLHTLQMHHGSLWPPNVLLGGKRGEDVRLADFGRHNGYLSHLVDLEDGENVRQSPAGSSASHSKSPEDGLELRKAYIAPEALVGRRWSAMADVYSLGCVIARLSVGAPLLTDALRQHPWSHIQERIRAGELSAIDGMQAAAKLGASWLVPQLVQVTSHCVRTVPTSRPLSSESAKMMKHIAAETASASSWRTSIEDQSSASLPLSGSSHRQHAQLAVVESGNMCAPAPTTNDAGPQPPSSRCREVMGTSSAPGVVPPRSPPSRSSRRSSIRRSSLSASALRPLYGPVAEDGSHSSLRGGPGVCVADARDSASDESTPPVYVALARSPRRGDPDEAATDEPPSPAPSSDPRSDGGDAPQARPTEAAQVALPAPSLHHDTFRTSRADVVLPTLPVVAWSQLHLEALIGTTHMGKVYGTAYHSHAAAVRRMDPSVRSLYSAEELKREIDQLATLNHANLARIVALVVEGPHSAGVLMQLAPTSLAKRLAQSGNVPMLTSNIVEAVSIVKQVAHGLAHLHSNSLTHGCLWPPNVLLGGRSQHMVKLSDYGRSKRLIQHLLERDEGELNQGARGASNTTAASDMRRAPYAAPELISGESWSASADVYALGCLTARMASGAALYSSQLATMPWHKVFHNICVGVTSATAEVPAGCLPQALMSLIEHCISLEPKSRPRSAYCARALEKQAALIRAEERQTRGAPEKERFTVCDGDRRRQATHQAPSFCQPAQLPSPSLAAQLARGCSPQHSAGSARSLSGATAAGVDAANTPSMAETASCSDAGSRGSTSCLAGVAGAASMQHSPLPDAAAKLGAQWLQKARGAHEQALAPPGGGPARREQEEVRQRTAARRHVRAGSVLATPGASGQLLSERQPAVRQARACSVLVSSGHLLSEPSCGPRSCVQLGGGVSDRARARCVPARAAAAAAMAEVPEDLEVHTNNNTQRLRI